MHHRAAASDIHAVVLQGYSTLGSQWLMQGFARNVVLQNAVVQAVAQEAGRDAAQVVLKWALQHGQVELIPWLSSMAWSFMSAEDSGQVGSTRGSLIWPREFLLRPPSAVHTSRLGAARSFCLPALHLLLHDCSMWGKPLNYSHHGECKARPQRGIERARRALPAALMTCCRLYCAGGSPEILQAGAHRRELRARL